MSTITNLSVVRADRHRRPAGARRRHRLRDGRAPRIHPHPLAFGFGTAIVAMVGTNWGARQYRRAREIAWTGAATVAAACATIGLIVALFPDAVDGPVQRRRTTSFASAPLPAHRRADLRLSSVLGWRFTSRPRASAASSRTVTANAVRLLASAVGGLVAIYWLDLGAIGFFVAIAGRILRLRSTDRCRDVQGEGAHSATKQ